MVRMFVRMESLQGEEQRRRALKILVIFIARYSSDRALETPLLLPGDVRLH